MNHKVITFVAAAFMVGGAAGWFTYKPVTVKTESDEDLWESFTEVQGGQISSSILGQQIISSGLIHLPKEAPNADIETENNNIVPPFPELISMSKINGVAHAHLKDVENGIKTATEGQTLDSGWLLKSVSLNGVVARYEDEERVININNYDLVQSQEIENAEEKLEE